MERRRAKRADELQKSILNREWIRWIEKRIYSDLRSKVIGLVNVRKTGEGAANGRERVREYLRRTVAGWMDMKEKKKL